METWTTRRLDATEQVQVPQRNTLVPKTHSPETFLIIQQLLQMWMRKMTNLDSPIKTKTEPSLDVYVALVQVAGLTILWTIHLLRQSLLYQAILAAVQSLFHVRPPPQYSRYQQPSQENPYIMDRPPTSIPLRAPHRPWSDWRIDLPLPLYRRSESVAVCGKRIAHSLKVYSS